MNIFVGPILLFTLPMKQMVLGLYRAANSEDFRVWVPRMLHVTTQVPTLVLWGKDPCIPSWVAHSFGVREVKLLDNCGH